MGKLNSYLYNLEFKSYVVKAFVPLFRFVFQPLAENAPTAKDAPKQGLQTIGHGINPLYMWIKYKFLSFKILT